MHFRPFSVKKKIRFFYDFADFLDFLTVFFFFLTICLILGFSPPPKTPDSPQVPHCRFILKIGKKSDFRCRPPKMDFRFLIYAPNNIYFKKYPFLCTSVQVIPLLFQLFDIHIAIYIYIYIYIYIEDKDTKKNWDKKLKLTSQRYLHNLTAFKDVCVWYFFFIIIIFFFFFAEVANHYSLEEWRKAWTVQFIYQYVDSDLEYKICR